MHHKKTVLLQILHGLALPFVLCVLLLFFFTGLKNLDKGHMREGGEQLEASLRRATTSYYASEGVYPPDLAHLVSYSGIQIDTSRFAVYYDIFAENLMPDITVLVKETGEKI